MGREDGGHEWGVGCKGLGWFSRRISVGKANRQHSNHSSVPFTFYLFEI